MKNLFQNGMMVVNLKQQGNKLKGIKLNIAYKPINESGLFLNSFIGKFANL